MTFNKSHRLPEIILNNNSGDSKLMNCPCDSPSNARKNRLFIFSREHTSKVTPIISGPPIVNFVPEIIKKQLGRNKFVRDFFLSFVPVITFDCLVVITKDTYTILHKRKSILERMAASRNGRGYLPYHHFYERCLRNCMSLV